MTTRTSPADAADDELRAFGLAYPGAHSKRPWSTLFRTLPALLVAASLQAHADTRFQVLGFSASHLAVRELSSGTACCGAAEPVDCGYPGLKQLGKRLPPLPSPYDVTRTRHVELTPLGVSIHFIPWQAGQWSRPPGDESPAARRFTIYQVATDRQSCTSSNQARQQLESAKAFAKEVGVDLQLEAHLQSKRLTPHFVNFDSCAGAKPSEDCENEYFRVRRDEELGFELLWKQPKRRAWTSSSNTDRFMVAPLLLLSSPHTGLKVYQLSEFAYGIAGTREFPRFLVVPAEETPPL